MSNLHAVAVLMDSPPLRKFQSSFHPCVPQSWADVSSLDGFCFPALSLTSNFGRLSSLTPWSVKRQSHLLRCFFLTFPFNNTLRNVFLSPQMYSQLYFISEHLPVLCSFLYFTLHSTQAPSETASHCSMNLHTQLLWKTLLIPLPLWLEQILAGVACSGRHSPSPSAGVYWAATP